VSDGERDDDENRGEGALVPIKKRKKRTRRRPAPRPYDDPHGIKAAREARGLSRKAIERQTGVPFQRVADLERTTAAKGAVPISRHLPTVLAFLGMDSSLFPVPVPVPKFQTVEITKTDNLPVFPLRLRWDRQGGEMQDDLVSFVERPAALRGVRGAYAARVWLDDMEPRFRPGDIIVIDPVSPPRHGSGVLLMSEDRQRVQMGDFISETSDLWTIQKFGSTPGIAEFSRTIYPVVHVVCLIHPER
jgi:transcriptional regulator with XRE-family HTH domain